MCFTAAGMATATGNTDAVTGAAGTSSYQNMKELNELISVQIQTEEIAHLYTNCTAGSEKTTNWKLHIKLKHPTSLDTR